MYIYTYINTDIMFDFIAVFSDIYHEIIRTAFLPKTTSNCFFLCQENCVCAKVRALICFEK